MKRLVFLFLFLSCANAQAQSSTRVQAQAVATCGGQSLTAGVFYPATQDLTGALCTNAAGGGGGGSVTQGTVPWVVSGQGTAGTAATGVVTVQGIASMTPLLSTLSAETTKVIGTVNQGTSPWVVSGSVTASGTVAATQSGTWTVQPGNTPNTTPWLVVSAPTSVAANGITPVISASAEASHVIKASPGNVYSAYATNLTATNGFLVLLNSTTAPADGAITPLACVPLPANGPASINYAPGPPGVFSTGVTAVVTSAITCFTKTTGTITAFISGSAQ